MAKKKSKKPTGITFPCDFPIKIMGLNTPEFEIAALSIIKKHFPSLTETAISQRQSADNKYLSITVTVQAKNKPQLDALYEALSNHPKILMVL